MKPIPFLLNLSYVALLVVTTIAVVLVFKKAVSTSNSKRKYLPPIFLVVLISVFTILSLNNVFLDTIKAVPPPFAPAIISTALFFSYFAFFYKPLHTFPESHMKFVVAIQAFRLPLELIFVWLLANNIMPIQMTFEGRNPDVLVGLTAPLVAYFGYHKKVLPKWVLVAWNIGGLILLSNIVVIALLSAPTNFQVFTNLPHNTIVFRVPYHLIPFFLVPLALFGHLFALRKLIKTG